MISFLISKKAVLLAGAACALVAGMTIHSLEERRASQGPHILYYHDPMHPAYRSQKPGIAPDCGMALEPVYEGTGNASAVPGAVQISTDQQQLIGMRTEEVRRAPVSQPIRLLARVTADETRTFVINAPVDSWIRQAGDATTGTLVKKGQKLGSFYTPEFLTAEQTYIYALASADRQGGPPVVATPDDTPKPDLRQLSDGNRSIPMAGMQAANLRRYADVLRNLGMGEPQLEELNQTRKPALDIYIYSPGDALVLARTITAGERFERGKEWFRLADLSTVWVVADVFENDARLLAAAGHAVVRYQGRSFEPRMTSSLPVFDPATRTLKLRMATANPGYVLRPDMFVDVDLEVSHPPAITIPLEAISEGGLRNVVYLDRGNGVFEPRQVTTGARLGNRVIVESGLQPGERIVVAGNFMLDSESRLQAGRRE